MFLPKVDSLTWKFYSKNYYKFDDGSTTEELSKNHNFPFSFRRYIIPNNIFDFYDKWTRYLFSILDPMIQQRTGFFAPHVLSVSTVFCWDERIIYGSNYNPENAIIIYLTDVLSNCSYGPTGSDNMVLLDHLQAMGQIIFVCCHELFHSVLLQNNYNDNRRIESETSACALNFMADNLDYLESIVRFSISDTVPYYRNNDNLIDLKSFQSFGSTIGYDVQELMTNQYIKNEGTINESYCVINCQGWITRFLKNLDMYERLDDVNCRNNVSIRFIYTYRQVYFDDLRWEYSSSIIIKEDGIYQPTAPALLTNALARYSRNRLEAELGIHVECKIVELHGKRFFELEFYCDMTELSEAIDFSELRRLQQEEYGEEDEEES